MFTKETVLKTLTFFLAGLLYLSLPVSSLAQVAKPTQGTLVSSQDSAAKSLNIATEAEVVEPVADGVLTGKVVNEVGKPIAGVTVTLAQEPNKSSITNSAGGFILRPATPAPVLRVSYAGYEEMEVSAKGTEPILVQLARLNNYERQLKKRAKAAEKAYRKP